MVTMQDYTIPSADLGKCNPLPDLKNVSYIHAQYRLADNIGARERAGIGKGMINTILPYKIQDGYSRERKDRVYRAAVVENRYIRAVFLPELGGRLWSLYDKETGQELLYTNPVFQPANLALRNAWFSGGVEYNVGIKGHNPLTCSPLFAEILRLESGEQILKMYEFERIREIVYEIRVRLPEDSRLLYVNERIENTAEQEKYVYWWTNMAVPETEKTRVIVPAEEAIQAMYSEGCYQMEQIPVPVLQGKDISYPANEQSARDFFYILPDGVPKWIAAVQEDGEGIVQISTNRLFGRKLFLWGQGTGGRNWNAFLSEGNRPYIEIQAGLARTQYEHPVIPAGACWEWTEAYGALHCDKSRVHSESWQTAQEEVERGLSRLIALKDADACLNRVFDGLAAVSSKQDVMHGSGWGALENKTRALSGKAAVSMHCDFPEESLNEEQQSWLYLMEHGAFPPLPPEEEPPSYVTGAFWLPLVEGAVARGGAQLWYAYLQHGLFKYCLGDAEAARASWEKSIQAAPSAWAWRNLAMLYKNEYQQPDRAAAYIVNAVSLNRECRGLLVECGMLLTAAGRDTEWLDIVSRLPDSLKSNGRIRLISAIAYIHTGRLDSACEIVNRDFEMPDIQEGELSISHIWDALYTRKIEKETGITDKEALSAIAAQRYPLPAKLDFRMH